MIQIWKEKERASELSLQNLAHCILDIREATKVLGYKDEIKNDPQYLLLKQMVRKVSVAVRKICLDGGGRLLRQCVLSPQLHAILPINGRVQQLRINQERAAYKGFAKFEDGNETEFEFPKAMHEVTVRSPPGIVFGEEGACIVLPPFDKTGKGVKPAKWLKQEVIQIDSVVYTAENLIRLVANLEGAHTNELIPFVVSGLNFDQAGKGNEIQYKMINVVLFGGLSYAQYFVLYTGVQIMYQASYITAAVLNRERKGPEYKKIERPPKDTPAVIHQPVFDTKISYGGNPMFVFGRDGKPDPREGSITKTLMQTPQSVNAVS